MMFVSIEQLRKSIDNLAEINPFFGIALLAFKRNRIPVGDTNDFNFTHIANDVLDRHYRPYSEYKKYYTPLKTSDKSKRWLADRYASTSLQRITTDTFSDALLHQKTKSNWGWRENYVEVLSKHITEKLPAFDLAIWLYREQEWPNNVTPRQIVEHFFDDYNINSSETDYIFDRTVPEVGYAWLSQIAISHRDLIETVGYPPGAVPDEGAAVRYIDVKYVGPASSTFRYEPSDRLNIITGDNGIGKTFIFEVMWWALTGRWLREFDPTPRRNVAPNAPQISFGLTVDSSGGVNHTARYDWQKSIWNTPAKKRANPGLVIYSRYDGSAAIFDPNRPSRVGNTDEGFSMFLNRDEVWHGMSTIVDGQEQSICNGLINDWVNWQTRSSLHDDEFLLFASCLSACSASEAERIEPGKPVRPDGESRYFPTIRTQYGDVVATQASAGVKRILALVYSLVWAWYEHKRNSELVRKEPQRRIILMIDEVEAHLHPKWQRAIVPALMKVISLLSNQSLPQLHIATHSPLVLASIEPFFDEYHDDVHHLYLRKNDVVLEELPFIKRGLVDVWLMSDVFGLKYPRSIEASQTLDRAKAILLLDNPPTEDILNIDSDLEKYLAPDDQFWPSWRYYVMKAQGHT